MKILVTGAAGFIGFHLVNRLIEQSQDVIGLDNINEYYDVSLKLDRLQETGIDTGKIVYGKKIESNRSENYSFVKLNLEDDREINRLFETEKLDTVIHLAAQAGVRHSISHPRVYSSSNLTGFINILEGCRYQKVRHLIFASSSSVYGNNEKIPYSEGDPVDHPISLYAATKKSNELMAHAYSHLFDLPCTGIRLFTVYGPWGRPDMAYYIFSKAISEGSAIRVFNYGDMERDFTYVDDAVEAINRLIDVVPSSSAGSAPFDIFNIGHHQPQNLLQFIHIVEGAMGKKVRKEFLPMQPGDVRSTFADIDKLRKVTGYKPQTSLEEGIQKFTSWFRSYHGIE